MRVPNILPRVTGAGILFARVLLDWTEPHVPPASSTRPARHRFHFAEPRERPFMNAWIILLLAGLLEIVWASGLRFTEGFTRLVPSVVVLALAWVSFYLLAVAMREIPVGTAYAVWTGIGATGVALLGMLMLKEPVTASRLLFLAMIVIGIIGLKWSSGSS